VHTHVGPSRYRAADRLCLRIAGLAAHTRRIERASGTLTRLVLSHRCRQVLWAMWTILSQARRLDYWLRSFFPGGCPSSSGLELIPQSFVISPVRVLACAPVGRVLDFRGAHQKLVRATGMRLAFCITPLCTHIWICTWPRGAGDLELDSGWPDSLAQVAAPNPCQSDDRKSDPSVAALQLPIAGAHASS
jgi:hypothetical protein